MDDPNQNWKHDSGIFRALGGTPKKARETSSQLTPPDLSLTRIPEEVIEFGDMRTLIYDACVDSYERSMPVSLFVIAIDELDGLKRNYGDLAAETANAFVLNLLIQTRNEFYGSSSKIKLGHYVLGRYLMLLPGTLGANATEFAEVLRKSVNEKDFIWNKSPLRLTVTIGVVHKPGHAGDQDYVIMQADQACSESMSIGGNKVTIAKMTEGF
ncbi:MAG: diguanylate cyclase [Candidatus Melainabacteria bacterium]|nr:diguanylate cyclase [Candidatus Melainabacteria bacterium]